MLTTEMQKLIVDGTDAAVVLGQDEKYLLFFVDETSEQEHAAYLQLAKSSGLPFAGIFVMLDGQAQCKCASWGATPVMILASATYARRIATKIKAEQSPRGDAVDWLANLFALPDERPS